MKNPQRSPMWTRIRTVVSVLVLLVLTITSNVSAQPSFFSKYKTLYEQADPGSDEQLDAVLKMVDVVFHYDLDMALEWSAKAHAIAEQAGNQDAEAAALMDQALWTAYKYDSKKSADLFSKAKAKFNRNGNPRFVAQYYSARFGYSMINEEEEYDPNEYLEEERLIAEKLDDPHLLMTYLYMASTSKVFIGKLPPTEESIAAIRKRLHQVTEEHGFETGKINSLLLDAQEARLAGNNLMALMTFAEALKYSKAKQYRLFEIRCHLVLANIEMQAGFYPFMEKHGSYESLSEAEKKTLVKTLSPIRERNEECLKIARQVKMASYIFESLIDLAFVEFHCGNTALAKKYLSEAESMEYDCFRSWALRDTMYRHAMKIYASEGNASKVVKYANLVASPKQIAKVQEATDKSTRYRQQLATAQQKMEKVTAVHQQVRASLVARNEESSGLVSLLQKYLLASGLLLGIAGLTLALFWNRSRLQKTSQQLMEEQETSRINREMRDVLQERVVRLQRMESLGMLAGGIAHDFNNLLVGVMCNAELLEMQSEKFDAFTLDRLRRIIDSADKASDLSRQMLAYTGKQQIEKCAVDLNHVIEKMTRVLIATVGETIKLSIELSPANLIFDGEETQVEQIILNLVGNSRNASEENGSILISTGTETIEHVGHDPRLYGEREEGGDFVFVDVRDFGSGFDEANSDRIFEPFYTTGDEGRGLGLSVVYGIVNGHDGFIRVSSENGNGTKFRILLPASNADMTPRQVNKPNFATAAPAKSKTKGTILIVDDEEAVRDLTTVLLERSGWMVEAVDGGELAVEILKRDADRFDCVALDILMPNVGAEEVLHELDLAKISLPIVLMSGYSDTRLDEFRKNKNISEIVTKPFRSAEFVQVIDVAARNRSGATNSHRPISR